MIVNDDTFTLEWQDGPCAGMEITCIELSGGQMLDLQDTRTRATADLARSWLEEASAFLIKSIVKWNLEVRLHGPDSSSEVSPVPITVEDFWRVLSLRRIRTIIVAWLEVVAGTPAPLSGTSSDGEQSQAPSSMTDLSSLSLTNSSEPSTSSES